MKRLKRAKELQEKVGMAIKMKGKTKFILGLFLGIVLGALIAIGVYFLTVGEVAWKEYVENELVPNIVVALSSMSLILITALPVVSKVMNAIKSFNAVTKDVNDTAKNGSDNAEKIENFTKEVGENLQGIADNFVNDVKALDERISRIEQSSQNTETITRIGFGNMEELVQKGYAAEIEKVGKDEGKEQETTES